VESEKNWAMQIIRRGKKTGADRETHDKRVQGRQTHHPNTGVRKQLETSDKRGLGVGNRGKGAGIILTREKKELKRDVLVQHSSKNRARWREEKYRTFKWSPPKFSK